MPDRTKVSVRNLSERSGTGKMRSYWQEKVYIIVSHTGNDPVTYNMRPEQKSKGETRTVHPNMLIYCDNLLHNFDWNIEEQASKSISSSEN